MLHGIWDLPGPGVEHASPVLASGLLTTGPPGKFFSFINYLFIYLFLAVLFLFLNRYANQIYSLFNVYRKWQPTPVFLPGESHGRRSLVGYSPRGRKESDTTEQLHFHFHLMFTGQCIIVYIYISHTTYKENNSREKCFLHFLLYPLQHCSGVLSQWLYCQEKVLYEKCPRFSLYKELIPIACHACGEQLLSLSHQCCLSPLPPCPPSSSNSFSPLSYFLWSHFQG